MINHKPTDTERCAWDALQEQAASKKAEDLDESFSVSGSSQDSLANITGLRLLDQGLATGDINRVLRSVHVVLAVREVYYTARHLGLIIPGLWHQTMEWGDREGVYQFSQRGLAFFRNGEISLSAPGLLMERIREVVAADSVDPGVIPLAEEAQRCWGMGCLRAAMVLIGLASEEVCTGLLDEMCRYPLPPSKGDKLHQDWVKLNNDALAFYPRWRSGLALIESVKQSLKKAYGSARPDWWRVWEPFPGAVQPFAEAVRIARNTAAHSVDDVFTSAQVGLLLASLPTMLGVIAELTEFLKAPPSGVVLPRF